MGDNSQIEKLKKIKYLTMDYQICPGIVCGGHQLWGPSKFFFPFVIGIFNWSMTKNIYSTFGWSQNRRIVISSFGLLISISKITTPWLSLRWAFT
jgi:hypothetical protein